MTITVTGAPARDRRRWLAYGLFASLLVNAFLIGLAATDLFRPQRVAGPLRFELRWLQAKLPAEAFARVREAVAAIEPQVQGHIDRLKELRRELGRLAAVPEPDRAAIDANLGAIRNELMTMTAEGQSTVADSLLSLPADVRARLAGSNGDR